MISQAYLKEYARLTANNGVNVSEGKYVIINCALCAAEFGRMVMKECFELGAKDVILNYVDQDAQRLRYEHADLEVFKEYPEWKGESRNFYAREGCVCIHIIADDPEAFAGVDSEKLMANTLAAKKAFKPFYDIMDKGGIRWTIVAYPSLPWARKVFPNDTDAKAIDKLWAAILKTVRIGRGDTVKKWQKHDRVLKRRAAKLNKEKFEYLRYTNSLGTNFTVGLAEGHIWKGGSEKCSEGVDYFPNMPTEEVFTMPDCHKAEGKVFSALPLSYQSELIDGFWLEFHEGKVVDYGAKTGLHALKRLLDTDEGSKRLGEVALIPYDSPISNLGILFYETLFDENASCHLALGSCYPDTMKGGEKLTDEELLEKGGNDSANHVDFMIGTSDLDIVGIKKDGTEVNVFEKGAFVL